MLCFGKAAGTISNGTAGTLELNLEKTVVFRAVRISLWEPGAVHRKNAEGIVNFCTSKDAVSKYVTASADHS